MVNLQQVWMLTGNCGLKKKARSSKGHFIKDDPETEVNEAWTTKIIKKIRPNKKKK